MRTASVLPVLLLTAGLAAQERFTDARYGIELEVPEKWRRVAPGDDVEVVGRFECHREFVVRKGEDLFDHRPVLTVLAFLPDSGAADYEAYLQREWRGAQGVTASEDTIGDLRARRYDVSAPASSYTPRLSTWVVAGDGFALALEFTTSADYRDKLEPVVRAAVQSLRLLPDRDLGAALRDRAARSASWPWVVARAEWRALPLTERHDVRRRLEDENLERARREAGAAELFETDHFLVVVRADRKYAKRVADAAEAFWRWCDRRFDAIGDDPVRRCVLVVADAGDEYAFTSRPSSSRGFELDELRTIRVARDNYRGSSIRGLAGLYTQVLDRYLEDKDVLLFRYLPRWLAAGTSAVVGGADVEGRRVEFAAGDSEREDVRDMERAGTLRGLRRLVTLTDDDYAKLADEVDAADQVAAAVRFLLAGRPRRVAGAFDGYLRTVIAVAERHAAGWDDDADTAAIVAEERAAAEKAAAERGPQPGGDAGAAAPPDPEAEAKRLRRELWKRRRQAISADVAREAFGWSDDEWAAVEKAFRRFVDKY